jgi:hypothetical protein
MTDPGYLPDFPFATSLSPLPGRKTGTLAAGILSGLPVLGLRPRRAARLRTPNAQNRRGSRSPLAQGLFDALGHRIDGLPCLSF